MSGAVWFKIIGRFGYAKAGPAVITCAIALGTQAPEAGLRKNNKGATVEPKLGLADWGVTRTKDPLTFTGLTTPGWRPKVFPTAVF